MAYTKVLENRVIDLQTKVNETDALTVSPPSETIANISTSDNADT